MQLSALTDAGVLSEVAQRLTAQRLALGLTQDAFAARAGVGRSTVQRLERGESIQLGSFVKLLRTVDRLDALGELLPPPTASPLALLAAEEASRRRAPRARAPRPDAPADAPAPIWGDEQTGKQ